MSEMVETTATRRRLRLLLLMAIFAAPLVFAYALYFGGWRPQGMTAHGELVKPARPVAEAELRTLDGRVLNFSSLRSSWLLLYFGSSRCEATCERTLWRMRQVISAQGREAHRVRAAMIVTDTGALDGLRRKLVGYPETLALTGSGVEQVRLARAFELPAGGALAGLHRIYVVDPLGNFMMSYPADADPNGMRKDLGRLLRYSQVGSIRGPCARGDTDSCVAQSWFIKPPSPRNG